MPLRRRESIPARPSCPQCSSASSSLYSAQLLWCASMTLDWMLSLDVVIATVTKDALKSNMSVQNCISDQVWSGSELQIFNICFFFLLFRRPKPIWMCRNKQIWSCSLYGTWTTYLTTINDHFSSISAFLLDSYSWRELEKAGKREDSVFGLKKTAFCIIFWCFLFFLTEKSSRLIEWIISCGPNLTSTE